VANAGFRGAAICLLSLLVAAPLSFAQPAARHLQREVARYLDLSPTQQQQLASVNADWSVQLQALQSQAQSRRDTAAREALCRVSRQRQAEHQQRTRALLSAEQLARLAALEQAFLLMPVIESAQSASLMPDRLELVPAGLPDGGVVVESNYRRAAAAPLPGCPAVTQNMRPTLDLTLDPQGKPPRR
jgi:hypothetical protein